MPASVTKHLFILNPRSFWNEWKLNNVTAHIRGFFKNTSDDYEIYLSRFPRDAVGFIESFAGKLPGETILRVYAVGGDGILFDCLNGVVGLPNVELAVMPYGRANSFVRGFGKKSITQFRDLARQVGAPSIPLDIMRSGGIYALSFCSVGITSGVIRCMQRLQDRLETGGPVTQWLGRGLYQQLYFLAGIPAFFDRNILMQRYDIEIDGERFSGPFRGILIANGCYYADNRCPAPAAVPTDGLLNVILARGAGPLRFISQLSAYMRGRQDKYPNDFVQRKARKITVSSENPILVNFDDVIFYDRSLVVEVLPGALRFVDASGQGYLGPGGGGGVDE